MTDIRSLSDLKAMMKEIEKLETNFFNKNTASQMASWQYTWFKQHGQTVIDALSRAENDETAK